MLIVTRFHFHYLNLTIRKNCSFVVPCIRIFSRVSSEVKLQICVNNFIYIYIFIYLFIYLLQLGCYPVAVVILHVNNT